MTNEEERKSTRKFTPNPEVARLYEEQKMTLRQVGETLGMSNTTALKHLDALDVPRRPRGRIPGTSSKGGGRKPLGLDLESVAREYDEGASTVELAKKYGVHQRTIHRRLKEMGKTRTLKEAIRLYQEYPRIRPGSLEGLAADLNQEPDHVEKLLRKHGFLT